MGLGDKSAALALAERAIAAIPIEKDAMDGPMPIEVLARVAAQTGESDRAIAALESALDTGRRRLDVKYSANTCIAPTRSDVRSVARRSAISKTLRAKATLTLDGFFRGSPPLLKPPSFKLRESSRGDVNRRRFRVAIRKKASDASPEPGTVVSA